MPGRFITIKDGPTTMKSAPILGGKDPFEATSTMAAPKSERIDTNFIVRIGQAQRPFAIQAKLLAAASPYLQKLTLQLLPPSVGDQCLSMPLSQSNGTLSIPEVDEFTFFIFHDWLHGKKLYGPRDFHSMTHYLSLYVFGIRFQIEGLRNSVIDLIRAYYDKADMSAPAFRLDYIYANTDGPSPMRDFLVHTAASRAVSRCENGRTAGISDSVKMCLENGGDLAADYAKALIDLANNPGRDVRRGDSCDWHEHKITTKCLS